MGNLITNKSSQSLRDAYNPSLNNWNMVQRGNQFNIWRNAHSHQEIQEYRFMVNDEGEFERQKTIFQARHNNNNLVASRFFVDDSERQFCANYFKGNMFLERIPLRLFELDKIGFPDILHVYSQCFKGFAELYDAVGFFSINEQMIGVNTDGVVKVWLNQNFGKSHPAPVYVQGTQRQMLIKLIKTLSNYSDNQLPINLSQLLLRNNPSSFRNTFMYLETLASRFNVDIPDYLSTAFGKMRRMIKNQSMVSSEMNYTSHINPVSRIISNKPDNYKYSVVNETVLNRETSRDQRMKQFSKKMPINFNTRLDFKGSNNSMASSFPQLSRISRISLPKQRKVQFVPVTTFSPPTKPTYQSFPTPKPTQFFPAKSPKPQKNTDLYYSTANTKIPIQNIKHLPIIRQNHIHQNSFGSSGKSLNYHVSDRNKLTQKYLNKFKHPQQPNLYNNTSINPQSVELNRTTFKKNTNHSNSFKTMNHKAQLNGDSGISKFSIMKKSQYQPSVNGISSVKQPMIAYFPNKKQSFYQSSKGSIISHNRNIPVISSSNTGVVYKQRDSRQPTLISQSSVINQSYSIIQQNRPIRDKISMMNNDNPYLNTNTIPQESYYSREMSPQLLHDLNQLRRKKFMSPQVVS